MPRRSTSPPTADDPSDQLEKLTRASAGSWRTKDGRFRIEGGGGGSWYLADTERRDQLGMELVSGPYPTLSAARAALTEARQRPPDAAQPAAPEIAHTATAGHRQSRRPSEQPPAAGGPRPAQATPARPSPPPSWIDQLPALARRTVRRTIEALEAAGFEDAEAIVRREHRSGRPEVARAVLLHRLGQLLDRAPDDESRSVAQAVELLASGEAGDPSLPGWRLVEAGDAARPILLSAADVRRRAKGR